MCESVSKEERELRDKGCMSSTKFNTIFRRNLSVIKFVFAKLYVVVK